MLKSYSPRALELPEERTMLWKRKLKQFLNDDDFRFEDKADDIM